MSELVLTDRWFNINEKAKNLSQQIQLKTDLENRTFKEYVIAAGRRSFKTERFIKRFAIEWMINNVNQQIFIGAPTRIQAKQIFWDDMKALFPAWYLKRKSDSELMITDSNNNKLQIVGLKEFKRVQGQRCHLALISEYQECDEGVWSETFQPMLIDTGGIALKEGRPYGKNHFFTDFKRGEDLKNNSVRSYHWTSEAVFTLEQIEQAKLSTGKSDYQREYLASFETDSQSPYYAYSVNNHKAIEVRKDLPFILTCDFNATTKPMSWVFGQRYISLDSDLTYWIKNFSNKFTNTQTQCEIVSEYWERYGDLSNNTLLLYGDYSGKAERSNSSYSDWQIIENYFRNKFKTVERRTKPCRSIRNSIAATNAQLCNTMGDKKQFVNENDCKELIQDWLKCEWKANGRELKDDIDDYGHMSRAIDYYNDVEHSIKGKPEAIWNH